ncbi:MAG: glycosyltransferase family 2 protein [Rhodomicrobium sp.]|nr:glycosyltransferase family 2 protein [Rhodomicrobium sp.]
MRDFAIAEDYAPAAAPSPAPEAAAAPDVSFIVAAYNAAPFIHEAIRSALNQTGASVEIVVVDDASTDGTAGIMTALADDDERIVSIRRETNGGPSAARNAAIASARGRWIAILDADDLILPERTCRLIDIALASGADIVADNFERFRGDGEMSGQTMIPVGREPYLFTVDTASFLRENRAFASSRFTLGAVKCMFRADFLRAHGIAHREGLDFGEDFLIILKCLMAGARFVVTSESYYKYRMHEASQSWRLKPSHLDQLAVMIKDERLLERFGADSETGRAARLYVRSFERAKRFVRVVELAKQRRYAAALSSAARRPSIWPFVIRFGRAAAMKRIKARLKRPPAGS